MYMDIQNIDIRHNTNLHPTISNLTKFQEGAYYSGSKIFSHPPNIKCLTSDVKRLRIGPKMFLNCNSFYWSKFLTIMYNHIF